MNVEESIHVAFDEFIMAPNHSEQVRNSVEEDENSVYEEIPEEVVEKEDEIKQVESPRVESIKAWKEEFEMSKMGELTYFLGLQVKQTKDGIFIHQSKYYNHLLKKFKMLDCKDAATPMATNCYLDLDETGKSVNQKLYRCMIGSLLYLTVSRPDIMHSVCLCARFQSTPKESHLTTVEIILKYLKGTKGLGLWYPNGTNLFLNGYSDSDFGSCKLDRKRTSGTCHLLGSSLISWHSKKQACVALSTTEVEYIVVGSCYCTVSLDKESVR
ncbi:uncharacterized protein LOC106770343 [Vigna radiata var. radiata]|uniref:Uncharacterized protein LOC106770343 n=1 Tax=Vigna radiata var. radiata TaxID=3916 RepID=A0A1S3V0G4_VIGRR|nr:uncharacterized protein LOC106770343 [Vigna radiata var. radiata]